MPSPSTNNADRPANNTRNYLSRVPPSVRSLLELPPRQSTSRQHGSRQQSGSTRASSTNVLARTDDSANGSGRGHLSRSTQPSLGSLSELTTRKSNNSSSRTKSSTKKTIPKKKAQNNALNADPRKNRAGLMYNRGSDAYERSVAQRCKCCELIRHLFKS